MTGLILKFSGKYRDANLPIYKRDPILSDKAGSLLLVDVSAIPSGVPLSGSLLRNIAADQAKASGIVGDTSATFAIRGDMTGANGRVERSAKGGIHVISSQAAAGMPANTGCAVVLPQSIVDYMVANPTHVFLMSQWRKLTRAAKTTDPDGAKCFAAVQNNASNGAFMLTHNPNSQEMPSTALRVGRAIRGAGANAIGDSMHSIAGPLTGAMTAAAVKDVAQFGRVAPQNSFAPLAAALPSWVLYRIYVEDLTVSGRTFEQVDAIDAALWQASFAAGGRFGGDTFTNPAVVP